MTCPNVGRTPPRSCICHRRQPQAYRLERQYLTTLDAKRPAPASIETQGPEEGR